MAPKRVLLIEDNEDMAGLIKLQLSRSPLIGNVRVVHDVSEAISAATEFEPDVLVIDHGLPGGSGEEVADRVRTLLPKARIVAFSGASEPRHWADRDVQKTLEGLRGLVEAVLAED